MTDAENADNQFDLLRMVGMIWYGRLTVFVATVISVALSILYLQFSTFSYTANLVVTPTQSQGQGLSSRLGDIASLAGVELPKGQGLSPYVIFPNTVGSLAVARQVSKRADIMKALFGGQMDPVTGAWREPPSLVHDITNSIKPLLGIPIYPWHPPGAPELQQYISQNVKVVEDAKHSLLILSYNDTDPKFAASFLTIVYQAADDVLRRMMLDRSTKYAAYLQNQLSKVQLAELKQVLTQSLSDQETTIMMGNADTPFAAQPLGSVEVSTRPTQPKPVLILAMGFFIGATVGCGLALLGLRLPFGRKARLPSSP